MCDIWTKDNGYYDGTRFWEQGPTELFPHIKIIEMFSGEPFVQKDTFRLIDLISAVNPKCLWKFYTNGHWRFNETIARALDDTLVYAQKRASQGRPFTVGIQFVLQQRNWREVGAIIEFCRKRNLEVFFLYAYWPAPESLTSLSAEEKLPVLESLIETAMSTRDSQVLKLFRTVFDGLDDAQKKSFRSESF